jgi:hypothetical protein
MESASMESALAQAREAGVTVVYATDDHVAEAGYTLHIAPPVSMDVVGPPRKQSYADRANPNQPWYAKFRKNKR